MIAKQPALLAILLFAGLVRLTQAGDVPRAANPEAPRLDTFGDPLPQGALARYGTIRFRHNAVAVAFLDKSTIVSVGSSIRFWDAATGRLLKERKHEKMAEPVMGTISADGKRAVVAYYPCTYRVWDIGSGQLVQEFDNGDKFSNLSWRREFTCLSASADASRFVALEWDSRDGSQQRASVYSLNSRLEPIRLKAETGEFRVCRMTPDGRTIALHDWKKPRVHLCDLQTGKRFASFAAHDRSVGCMEYTPDGSRLLTGSDDTSILCWDMTRPEWRSRSRSCNLTDGDLAMHWERLRTGKAEDAFRSKWALAGDPARTIAFVRERLKPEQPLPTDRIRKWAAELDSGQFSVRERASRELCNHFDEVEPELRSALKSANSTEARSRLNRIIESSKSGIPESDVLRRVRANEVLEQIGTPEARDLLRRLAASEVPTAISRDAAQSLKRLEARPP